MAIHSSVKIFVHSVWGTHNHEKIITKKFGAQLFEHFVQRSVEEKIPIEQLYFRPEHVHMLFELPSTRSMEEVARLFKGESSHWVSENNLTKIKFKWQRGYGAYSVSASQLEKVKQYISNQDVHHSRKSFKQEYDEWQNQYGIQQE